MGFIVSNFHVLIDFFAGCSCSAVVKQSSFFRVEVVAHFVSPADSVSCWML